MTMAMRIRGLRDCSNFSSLVMAINAATTSLQASSEASVSQYFDKLSDEGLAASQTTQVLFDQSSFVPDEGRKHLEPAHAILLKADSKLNCSSSDSLASSDRLVYFALVLLDRNPKGCRTCLLDYLVKIGNIEHGRLKCTAIECHDNLFISVEALALPGFGFRPASLRRTFWLDQVHLSE